MESVGYEVPARYQSGIVQLASEHKAWSLEMHRKNLQQGEKKPEGRAVSWRPERSVIKC